jgi:diacylglycerol O-acyltransferase / wax synthase
VSAMERLRAEDARILSLEAGNIRGHSCKVVLLDGGLGVDELRQHVLSRLAVAGPRLGQRIVPTPLRLAPPAWVDDPAFAIERHVRAADPPAVGEPELRALVARLLERPLDLSHPPWTIDVAGPLAGGRTALVWRLHHAMADGTEAMRLLDALLLDREQRAPAPPPARASADGLPSTAGLIAAGAAWRVRTLAGGMAGAARSVISPRSSGSAARALTTPR